jgi:hypothetical protein
MKLKVLSLISYSLLLSARSTVLTKLEKTNKVNNPNSKCTSLLEFTGALKFNVLISRMLIFQSQFSPLWPLM